MGYWHCQVIRFHETYDHGTSLGIDKADLGQDSQFDWAVPASPPNYCRPVRRPVCRGTRRTFRRKRGWWTDSRRCWRPSPSRCRRWRGCTCPGEPLPGRWGCWTGMWGGCCGPVGCVPTGHLIDSSKASWNVQFTLAHFQCINFEIEKCQLVLDCECLNSVQLFYSGRSPAKLHCFPLAVQTSPRQAGYSRSGFSAGVSAWTEYDRHLAESVVRYQSGKSVADIYHTER